MDQLSTGMGDLQRGFAALRAHPRCWRYVVMPALVTAVLLVGLVLGIRHITDPLVDWVAIHLPHWLAGIVGGLLHVVVVIGLAAGALVVFVPLVGLIAGPFAERLSEHLEEAITGKPGSPFALGEFAQGLVMAIGHGLRRLLASLGALIVIVLVGWIPVVGTIAALVATVWFAAQSAAYDCYDAVLGRQMMSYGDKLRYLARHRGRTTGLGAAVAL